MVKTRRECWLFINCIFLSIQQKLKSRICFLCRLACILLTMQSFWILLASLVCFMANLFAHHQLPMAVLNSAALIMSWRLFKTIDSDGFQQEMFGQLMYAPVLISLGLIPLFRFNPKNDYVVVLFLASLIFLLVYKRVRYLGKIFLLISFAILLIGNLIMGRIIYIPSKLEPITLKAISINKEQTIFLSESIPRLINQHRGELVLPYGFSFLLYNNFVYIPYSLANLNHFISLKNFYDVLLLANIYPLLLGAYFYFKDFQRQNKFIIVWMTITLFTVAINRSADKFNSLYLQVPLLLILILMGLSKVNMRLYLSLLVLSFIMLFTPIL